MLAQEIIRDKRDGRALAPEQIDWLIASLTDGSLSEGQAAAFAMAVFFRGMDPRECAALTRAMTNSGKVLDWTRQNLPGPVLDKHSTGGVGDNVSLMLAPMVAACGGFVPMISGRGLGHTGGTLDKLDSIPGYASQPGEALFARVVKDVGCAIIGQTADLAPADRRLYAIRDVTATVESIPLITASILSKKLAAGLQGLAMDVKCGSGAFMPTLESARALARSIVDVAAAAGLPARALITDMDQPLAQAAGNAVEVQSAVDYLTGAHRDPRLHAVTLALGAQMLVLGKLAADDAAAASMLERALASGAAAQTFGRMVAALGGPADFVERAARHLPQAPLVRAVPAEGSGFVAAIDTRAVGIAVVAMGGGRRVAADKVDPAVGYTRLAGLGAHIARGEPLGFAHVRTQDQFEAASWALRAAVALGDVAPLATAPVVEALA